MPDERQEGIPDYEKDPLNYLLSVGLSMEDIQKDYLDADIPLWEAARAVHNILERGESLDKMQSILAPSRPLILPARWPPIWRIRLRALETLLLACLLRAWAPSSQGPRLCVQPHPAWLR